ncbi:FtsQ-type POTRA domain-containing protein [bacterium]|nr:FtsQ-type POTRA domain-containing protein [bacterium]
MKRARIAVVIALAAVAASSPVWYPLLGEFLSQELTGFSESFRVQQVVVVGNRWIPADTVICLADVPLAAPLLSLPVAVIEKRVMQHVWVERASVRRMPPHTVKILITEREPVAAIRSENLLIATRDGMAVAPVSDDWVWDLPLLTVPKYAVPPAGMRIHDTQARSLLHQIVLLRSVSLDAWRNLNEIHSQDGQIVATFSEPPVELLLNAETNDLTWSYIARFLNHAPRYELSRECRLDARFPGRIIVKRHSTTNRESEIG